MRKQTAVQWLVEQLENHNGVTRAGFEKCIQEAISMEKNQIVMAFAIGQNNGVQYVQGITKLKRNTEYYNETFKIKQDEDRG